jgi:RHS repeat-associated protein
LIADITTAVTSEHNYFRDYDPAIGRYLESDPIGLRGGINTYAYVGSSPVLDVDPRGLVKWRGTGVAYGAIVGGGGVFHIYELRSECVNNRRVHARVHARGFAVGFGLALAGPGGHVTLEDGYSTPDHRNLEGSFKVVWGTVASGIGYGIGALQLGEARSIPSRGLAAGIDLSAGGAAGLSTVVQQNTEECCAN